MNVVNFQLRIVPYEEELSPHRRLHYEEHRRCTTLMSCPTKVDTMIFSTPPPPPPHTWTSFTIYKMPVRYLYFSMQRANNLIPTTKAVKTIVKSKTNREMTKSVRRHSPSKAIPKGIILSGNYIKSKRWRIPILTFISKWLSSRTVDSHFVIVQQKFSIPVSFLCQQHFPWLLCEISSQVIKTFTIRFRW